MNKKIILSLLLVLLVAVSVSAVAAADDLAADGDDATVTEDEAVTVTEDAADIQKKIDDAKAGDTIELENKTYDVGNSTFTFDKQVTVKGNGATIEASGAAQGGSGALFIAEAAGTGFEGITFINTDGHKEYGEQVSGYAIQLAIENGTVDNCQFIDWGSGVYGRGAAFCTISNSYFNGSSESVTNGGKKEYGTKAINLMGSHDITVKGCTFEGQVLDAISIASNSGNNIMTDNTFIENCYAIYFGGASTQGCVIANNTFIRCGYCVNDKGEVIFKDLPVISTQKAANGYVIADNEIEAMPGSLFMKAESGNTAHGYPSKIGDINITGNEIYATEGADAESITFMYILSNSGPLSPYAPIAITDNTIEAGITPLTVWYADWDVENASSDAIIPAADKAKSFINVKEIASADGTVTVELVDVNNEAQAGQALTYTINGGNETNISTDENGLAVIEVDAAGDALIAVAFAGNDQLDESSNTVSFRSTATEKLASVLVVNNMTTTAITNSANRDGEYFIFQLNDPEGNPLVNKTVQVGFNGNVYTRTTNENGTARVQVNLNAAGGYTFAVSYLGDEEFNASFAVAKITVNKQKGSLTAPAKSYKASAKTKSLTTTFKDDKGQAVKGKKVTFTVNGKSYTATTNANGVATVKVSLSTKKTYSYTVKFAGDNTFNAITKTGKVTIK